MFKEQQEAGAARSSKKASVGKQVGGRVVGKEIVPIECRADGVGSCEPELGFWCGMESYWRL